MNYKKGYPLAVEYAKTIINECLDMGYTINTQKLQKLMVLIQGYMLEHYKRPFFTNQIIATKNAGVMIPDVDKAFKCYELDCKEKQQDTVSFLDDEIRAVKTILCFYGKYDAGRLQQNTKLKHINDFWLKSNDFHKPNISDTFIEKFFSMPHSVLEKRHIQIFTEKEEEKYC